MTKDEKIEKLNLFSVMLNDFVQDYVENGNGSLRIGDDHHILWAGNPDSKIMVIQMHPELAEVNAAERHQTHKGIVCAGPGGHTFRKKAKAAGFNVSLFGKDEYTELEDEDFFYMNMIPFYPVAGSEYPEATVYRLYWLYEDIKKMIDPTITIMLGYEVFKNLVDLNDKRYFWKLCAEAEPRRDPTTGKLYLTVEDPIIVQAETQTKKNKALALSLKRLYTKRDYYLRGDYVREGD